jgi:hypothetical protein
MSSLAVAPMVGRPGRNGIQFMWLGRQVRHKFQEARIGIKAGWEARIGDARLGSNYE